MTKLEELRAKRAKLKAETDMTLSKMKEIANESLRLADELRQKREAMSNQNKKKIKRRN